MIRLYAMTEDAALFERLAHADEAETAEDYAEDMELFRLNGWGRMMCDRGPHGSTIDKAEMLVLLSEQFVKKDIYYRTMTVEQIVSQLDGLSWC